VTLVSVRAVGGRRVCIILPSQVKARHGPTLKGLTGGRPGHLVASGKASGAYLAFTSARPWLPVQGL
jgi:hypothetical protein